MLEQIFARSWPLAALPNLTHPCHVECGADMTRAYVVCCNKACHSWLWTDRCSKHTHCSQCYTPWAKSIAVSGQAAPSKSHWPSVWESASWRAPKPRRPKVQPPPGLDIKAWPAEVLEALKEHWGSFDGKLQATLKSHGLHTSKASQAEPDLKEICKQHLAALPESIQKLVQEPKQEPTYGQAVSVPTPDEGFELYWEEMHKNMPKHARMHSWHPITSRAT